MTSTNLVDKFDALLTRLTSYDKIALFGHVSPDGDCYGSLIGLKEILKKKFPNKEVKAFSSGLPLFFDDFGALDAADDNYFIDAFAIMVDVSNLRRVEDKRITLCKEIFIIDHHIPDESLDENNSLVDTSFVSCAGLIAFLAFKHNLSLSSKCASALYLGLITDSNRFLYAPIDNRTFIVAGYLMHFAVDYEKMYKKLYEQEEKDLRLKGYVLSHYQVSKNGVLYFVISKEELAKLKVNQDEVASKVNLLSNVKGHDIFAFFVDGSPVRVELRSSVANVRDVASSFGGGGHLHAAGCRLSSLDEVMQVIDRLDAILEERNHV